MIFGIGTKNYFNQALKAAAKKDAIESRVLFNSLSKVFYETTLRGAPFM